ncbi:diacylglycerol kinase family protein [Bacillus taeanensis]|uniref:Diacylglycerol kinase n=1 Tax=Bacillus taeanensis TaxID=273032 RepID=A0A366Y2T1_9BACI|nr:diacylglycerol kinase family protein [Bacillus taeanensis]RBW70511.1 diacylglycerol kinase [Bacillus taeanensis]
MALRDKKNPTIIHSFRYALEGIWYAFKNERNFRIHTAAVIVVLVMAKIFALSVMKISILIIVIGIVLALELMNTAIECVVDLASPDYHPLAKIAKDTASGAVFIFSIVAVIIGVLFFIPPILRLVL